MPLKVSSPAFAEGSTIPKKYTGDGENLSPPLSWSGAPPDTRSFAMICEDPDAPSGTFRHWAVGNIPADENGLSEGVGREQASGGEFARNDFGHAAYDGPAPPRGHGLHHYHFVLAALDTNKLEIPPDVGADEFWRAVEPHILARAETIGTYQR
jgi:Raf kinase inhibitor-like YbhB/YbcL family protein